MSGSFSFFLNSLLSRFHCKREWIVDDFVSHSCDSRFAALPVGAQHSMIQFGYILFKSSTIARTTVVFPVPGPPLIIDTGVSNNVWMAWICVSSYVIPMLSCMFFNASLTSSSSQGSNVRYGNAAKKEAMYVSASYCAFG